jgi:hypothetical protein
MHDAPQLRTGQQSHDDDSRAGPGLAAWILGAITVEFVGLVALFVNVL